MHSRLIAFAAVLAVSIPLGASVQQYPVDRGYPPSANGNVQPGPSSQPSQPDQPVQPQLPTLERRAPQQGARQAGMQPPAPRQPQAPFTLTPQEQTQVDQVLGAWEQRNRGVKTFDSRFKRWVYDSVFGRPDQPRFVELGVLRYAAPDRGMFRVDTVDKDGKEESIDPTRAEHWVADGKSIIEFSHVKKQMIVHKLPPELQGKAIADSPLPFLFGSDAEKLKQRYFIRLITPDDAPGQIWLEAFPRFQQDAANFHHAQFIITAEKMEPYALKLIQPNGKDSVVYRFYEVVMNDPMPRIFRGDPFRPPTPFGWQQIVEEPQGVQAQRPADDGRR